MPQRYVYLQNTIISFEQIQSNLDLVILNLVKACDLVTIFQRPFFNLRQKLFDLVTLCDLETVFEETKSVTKSRLHCMLIFGEKSRQCLFLYSLLET